MMPNVLWYQMLKYFRNKLWSRVSFFELQDLQQSTTLPLWWASSLFSLSRVNPSFPDLLCNQFINLPQWWHSFCCFVCKPLQNSGSTKFLWSICLFFNLSLRRLSRGIRLYHLSWILIFIYFPRYIFNKTHFNFTASIPTIKYIC